MRKPFAVLAACVLGLSGCQTVGEVTVEPDSIQPFLRQFTDSSASAAQIGLLRNSSLPQRESEVRIWVGFGILIPEEMLRFRISKTGEVSGAVLVHYPRDLSYMDSAEQSAFRASVLQACDAVQIGQSDEVCWGKLHPTPDWAQLFRRLVRYGLLSLRDQSTLPAPKLEITDGTAMLVEIRSGSSYRSYEYSNPGFRDAPEDKAAERIIRTVGQILNRLPYGS